MSSGVLQEQEKEAELISSLELGCWKPTGAVLSEI